MSKCKKRHQKRCHKRKKKYPKKRKCYKRDRITRTTKCKGGCIPTTSQILSTTQPFGGTYTQTCGSSNLVGCGTVGCGVNLSCGMDPRYDPLTSGAYPGSTESHLHLDRCGNIYCHSHAGGDLGHSHDSCGEDRYLGRVSSCSALSTNPDCLDEDVLGGISCVCGVDKHCVSGNCVGGRCHTTPSTLNLNNSRVGTTRCGVAATTCGGGASCGCGLGAASCGRIGGVRDYTGNLVGGFRDLPSELTCNSCRFTSGSFCNGSTLGHCNLAGCAPGNANTLPPSSLNTRQKTVDLRGFKSDGLSCIQSSLCGTKRPTVCKTKIKEVYR